MFWRGTRSAAGAIRRASIGFYAQQWKAIRRAGQIRLSAEEEHPITRRIETIGKRCCASNFNDQVNGGLAFKTSLVVIFSERSGGDYFVAAALNSRFQLVIKFIPQLVIKFSHLHVHVIAVADD